jgi:fructokinase
MIVSCGEALIDFFRHEKGQHFEAIIGGSPLNVAVALANAGSQCALMTNLSNDQFGDMHLAHLTESKVSDKYITRSSHPSGLMLVSYNANKSANYIYYGHNTAELNFFINQQGQQPPDLTDVNCLHFGSFSLVCGNTAQSFDRLITDYKAQCIISADINLRTAIEADLSLWRAKFNQLMCSAHILKASAEDLCLLYDLEDFSAQIAIHLMMQWLQCGVTLAVITDAENGAYALIEENFIHVPAVAVDIIDTVGAGDCFMAHLLHQLDTENFLSIGHLAEVNKTQITQIMQLAIKAASFTIGHKGAIFPTLIEITD